MFFGIESGREFSALGPVRSGGTFLIVASEMMNADAPPIWLTRSVRTASWLRSIVTLWWASTWGMAILLAARCWHTRSIVSTATALPRLNRIPKVDRRSKKGFDAVSPEARVSCAVRHLSSIDDDTRRGSRVHFDCGGTTMAEKDKETGNAPAKTDKETTTLPA